MKVLLFIFLLPLVLLARLAALLRPEEAVRPASFRLGALVPLIALLLAFLVQSAAAQQSFFVGVWNCGPTGFNRLECLPDCSANPAAVSASPVLACSVGLTAAQCMQTLGLPGEPLCCIGYASNEACRSAAATPDPPTNPPPGPDPVVPPTNPDPDPVAPTNPNPDPVAPTNPEPPTRTANVRDDNAGESTKGGALPLIAGGLFLAHYIISNATGDDGAGILPEGLELDPHSVISHRDGVSSANAGLTARYGDWLARISSSHSGVSWARPNASLQWSYHSSSWEFRAYAAQSGGAWSRPRAQVEWGWRF